MKTNIKNIVLTIFPRGKKFGYRPCLYRLQDSRSKNNDYVPIAKYVHGNTQISCETMMMDNGNRFSIAFRPRRVFPRKFNYDRVLSNLN